MLGIIPKSNDTIKDRIEAKIIVIFISMLLKKYLANNTPPKPVVLVTIGNRYFVFDFLCLSDFIFEQKINAVKKTLRNNKNKYNIAIIQMLVIRNANNLQESTLNKIDT